MRNLMDTCLFLSEGHGLFDDCRTRRTPLALVVLEADLPADLEDREPALHAALQARMDRHLGAISAGQGMAACLGAATFALLLPRVSPRQALRLAALELGPALELALPAGPGHTARTVRFCVAARALPGADAGLERALLRLLADADARPGTLRRRTLAAG